MPTATDSRRALAHQRNLAAAVGGVTSVVASLALGADLSAIDTWYWGVADALMSRVSAGYSRTRRIGTEFYRRDALAHGVDLSPIPSSFNRDKALTALRVTGPVAFKQSIRAGATPVQARQVMAVRMQGAAQRLTLAGDRDVFDATLAVGQGIVGWRRRLGGRGCGFCAMLASRGAVYVSEQRASSTRFGVPYHDRCRCYPEPLYEVEDGEPADVRELQRQWERVTAGHSGRDAVRVWRRHWERVTTPTRQVLDLAAPVAEAVDPALKMTVAQLKAVAKANGVPLSILILGTRKADIVANLRSWERTYEVKLSGLAEFTPPRVPRPTGFEGVPPLGVPPPGPVLTGSALNEWSDWFKHDLDQRTFRFVDASGSTPAEGVRVADLRVTLAAADGSYPGYVVRSGTAWRIDGTSYLIEHGPDDFGAPWVSRALKELREAHDAIPAARLANKSYTILAGENPADVYWRKVYSKGHVSAMNAGRGHIFVWGFDRNISRMQTKVDLLRHETGHNLDHMVGPGKSGSGSVAWDQAANADAVFARNIQDLTSTTSLAQGLAKVEQSRAWPKGVTDYGRSSQVEDFAESVMLYQMGPIAKGRLPGAASERVLYFRDIYPDRAKILDKLFPDVAKAQKAEIAALRRARPPQKQTLAQLRQTARERGLVLPTGIRRAEIEQLLSEPVEVAKGRLHQRAIDEAAKTSDFLDRVAEMVGLEARLPTMRARIVGDAARFGTPDRVRDAMLRVVDTGDMTKVEAELARLVKGAKLQPIETAGAVTTFRGATHEAISGSIRPGAKVQVLRPGFYKEIGGVRVQLSKAVVEEITEAEAREILARAAAKAVTKTADPADLSNLSKLTVARLRALAKERGVKIPPGVKKADIVDALRAAETRQTRGPLATGDRALQSVPVDLDRMSVSDPNYRALMAYRSQGFRQVNDYLARRGIFANDPAAVRIYSQQTEEWIRAVDATMARSRLTADVEVWRGLQVAEDVLGSRDTWPRSFVGRQWTDPAFVSTSASRSVAEGFAEGSGVMLRIRTPKGTSAIRLGDRGEAEILLDRGLTFKVTGDRVVGGIRVLDVDVVPSSKAVAVAKKAMSDTPQRGVDTLPRTAGKTPSASAAAKATNPSFGSTGGSYGSVTYRDAPQVGKSKRYSPDMGPLPSGAFEENCSNVVLAWDMRMRGFDVQAAPLHILDKYGYAAGRTFGEMDELFAGAYRSPGGGPHGRSLAGQRWRSFDEVDAEILREWPDGGRGVIFVGRHIFNVTKTGGKVHYIEAQFDASTSRTVTALYRRKYADRSGFSGGRQEAKVIRLDDLVPTDGILEAVVAV